MLVLPAFSCTSEIYNPHFAITETAPPPASIFEPASALARARGFVASAAPGDVQHFFIEDYEVVNAARLNAAEGLIAAIADFIDLGAPPRRIFHVTGRDQYAIGLNEVAININSNDNAGWIVYS